MSELKPMNERTGDVSTIYFTRDLSANGLSKVYEKINENISGKVAVKLHTGEQNGPNIIPSSWVKEFLAKEIPNATIVETNTLYEGDRYTTELHRETLKVNGWDFCPVDIMDENGIELLPLKGGKHFEAMAVGKSLTSYDSFVTLTHFKGHTMGGFGGSNKNIGIGCADGRLGKSWIHTKTGSTNTWSIAEEEFMERITESTKSVWDFYKDRITFINVMRNMSVDCDCAGREAAPVVTPNVGILGSRDICAIDTASVDIVFAMSEDEHHDLVERITSRKGLRQLTYMKEIGMGNDRYKILDLDNDLKEITPEEIVKNLEPFHNH